MESTSRRERPSETFLERDPERHRPSEQDAAPDGRAADSEHRTARPADPPPQLAGWPAWEWLRAVRSYLLNGRLLGFVGLLRALRVRARRAPSLRSQLRRQVVEVTSSDVHRSIRLQVRLTVGSELHRPGHEPGS